jgi:hypothetical protein
MVETKVSSQLQAKNKAGTFFQKREEIRSNFFFQPKLTIGAPGDAFEIEADAIADKVMQMSDGHQIKTKIGPVDFQRKCSDCEEEEKVRRKDNGKNSGGLEAPDIVNHAIRSSGQSLDMHTRSFMESRFGYDFSSVKIHTDTVAAKSAHAINALAYTSGNSIVFNEGQYSPRTDTGKKLLAHELTHVVQQNQTIKRKVVQRCPDPTSLALYDTQAAQVRVHPRFIALPLMDKRVAEQIITLSRDRDDCIYLINQLQALVNTPVDLSPAVGAAASAIMASAADIERDRLATPEGSRLRDVEERMGSDPARHWETISPPSRSWGHMATFRIDRSDPNNIVIQTRIRVSGSTTDVANVVAQEDGIEKAAQEMGYTLDVIFVNASGPDVFNVSINPAAAVTAGNWSAYRTDPSGYTHEIHHLLGLDDRYDYTIHAHNTRMNLHSRLHWFRIHVGRPPDPLGERSLMGSGNHLLDDDICRVSQLNFASCMASRQTRRNMVMQARASAFAKAFKVFQILSLIRPSSPFGETQYQFEQQRALSMAQAIFGTQVSLQDLIDVVGAMRYSLTPSTLVRYMQSSDTNCNGNAAYVVSMAPPISICPQFFTLSADQQVKSFLCSAAQLSRIDNSIPVNLCQDNSCSTPCTGYNNADTWAKFIWCASFI